MARPTSETNMSDKSRSWRAKIISKTSEGSASADLSWRLQRLHLSEVKGGEGTRGKL
jgi:hypothetical protein